jgi:hypothetical protein
MLHEVLSFSRTKMFGGLEGVMGWGVMNSEIRLEVLRKAM